MTKHSRVDLKTVKLPKTPNAYLIAPKGYCSSVHAHDIAPIFDMSRDALWVRVLDVVNSMPRVVLHDQDKAQGYVDFTQRSLVFRFPDRIVINVLTGSTAKQSTIAVLSRSKYGRSDLGANKARVTRMLSAIPG